MFSYDAENGVLTTEDYVILAADQYLNQDYYDYYYDVEISRDRPDSFPVEAPEGLETEEYLFTAQQLVAADDDDDDDVFASRKFVATGDEGDDDEPVYDLEDYSYQTEVGFDGNDVYFHGFSDDTAEFWAKGTLSEDGKTVTIPASQYMGQLAFLWFVFDYYVTAVGEDEEGNMVFEDLVLNYDAATHTFTTDQYLVLNSYKDDYDPYQVFTDVVITKIEDVAATPANPSVDEVVLEGNYPKAYFIVPAEDVDGNAILASKLFYTVWVKKAGVEQPYTVTADAYEEVEEDMVEIPYNYDDGWDIYKGGALFYFNPTDEAADFEDVGIQSIYYGGGECNKTDIIWAGITTSINDINTANSTAVYYDLQGRKVTAAQKGLLIKQTRQDNGTVKTVKVIK